MSLIGKNSMICHHGQEDGKCEYCVEEYVKTGVKPVATQTYGESITDIKLESVCHHSVKETVERLLTQFRDTNR